MIVVLFTFECLLRLDSKAHGVVLAEMALLTRWGLIGGHGFRKADAKGSVLSLSFVLPPTIFLAAER